MTRRIVLCVLACLPALALAQGGALPSFQCALETAPSVSAFVPVPGEPTPDAPSGPIPTRPLGRSIRALVVFVRFDDDDRDNGFVPCWRPTEDRTALPPFAERLFVPHSARDDPDAFDPESVTDFFYRQSAGAAEGPQVVTGDLWPRGRDGRPFVYVPRFGSDHYRAPERGYWTLVDEILSRLETQPGLRLADYDGNGDGVFDQVVVVVRGDGVLAVHGVSDLTASVLASGSRPAPRRYGGVGVDWGQSGQILFVQNLCFAPTGVVDARGLAFTIAHEFGHDLFPALHDQHLYPAFLNGLPTNEVYQPPSVYRRSYDYTLMGGAPYPYPSGAKTMSAYEREALGWLQPVPIRRDAAGLRATDLYTTGVAYALSIGRVPGAPDRRLLLANRQRVGAFDRLESIPYPGVGEPVAEGLKTTGLAVELVQDLDPGEPLGASFDLIPADGTLEGSSFKSAYAGDLFGPDTASQLTPWTRPNVNGCFDYTTSAPCNAPGFVPVWSALDRFRYAGDADSTLVFDAYLDWRTAAEITIREDSWMGAETTGSDGAVFTSPVRVTNGATLRVEGGGTVHFAGGLVTEPGARFDCAPGSTCLVGDGVLGPGLRVRVFSPFPNPTRGAVAVPFSLTSPADVSAVVLDALGREVLAVPARTFGVGAGRLDVDVSRLPAGRYLLRLHTIDAGRREDRLTAPLSIVR